MKPAYSQWMFRTGERFFTLDMLAGGLLLLCMPLLLWQGSPVNQLDIPRAAFLSMHSLLEIISIVISGLIFFTAFGTRNTERTIRIALLGCFFLATTLLDSLHTLSYGGMPDLVSPNTTDKSILFWLAARISAGLGLLSYALWPSGRPVTPAERCIMLAVTLGTVVLMAWGILFHESSLPAMYLAGQGLTSLKIALEWGIFALYFLVAIAFYRRRNEMPDADAKSLVIALLIMSAGELFFTLYVQVSSTANLLGHIYKTIGYSFLYRAIFAEAVRQPFLRIEQLKNEVMRERDFATSLIDTAPVIILLLDTRGVIQHINPYFAKLSGYKLNEVKGKDWFTTFIPAHDQARIRALFHQSSHGTPTRGNVNPILTRSGEILDIKWNDQTLYDADGTITGLLAIGQDVTAQRKMESERLEVLDALQHSERELKALNESLEIRVSERTSELISARDEAERANKAKSEFLSSMSHELRTPMNAILGYAQLMDYDSTINAEQKDNVQEMLKAGNHLLVLINEVLDLARIESGHLDLSIEPVEVSAVIEECLRLVKNLSDMRGIQISYSGLQSAMVRADRTRFKQAVLNLLSNAVKYNRDGGNVRITVQTVAAERLRILVSDTGHGIAAAHLSELFLPFNRLHASHSAIEGTGIGLTITRRIVEMMGGMVDVESEVGVGSTFWIELPLEYSPPSASGKESASRKDLQPAELKDAAQHTVLYIEDNPSNLKLVAQILGKRKHIRQLTAHTPELGIELARLHLPDIILLDINMPGMDGYQVLEIFKADAGLSHTPVIAVTANAMPRDIERGFAAGFRDYLTKPIDISRLYSILDQHLPKHARQ